MNYLIWEEPHCFVLKKKDPFTKKSEALLRVHNVGICGTDIHTYGENLAFFNLVKSIFHYQ